MKRKTSILIVLIVSVTAFVFSCRSEASTTLSKIDKIQFAESSKSILVGELVTVAMTVEPKDAKNSDTIEYRSGESGIVAIRSDSGNDGVVFEGLKRGTTVITASVNGVMDYCNVIVGNNDGIIPHIIVPYYVLECRENERRSIVASLAGGTPLDDNGFIWNYSNQKTISLETAGNVGVFDTVNIGDSIITISHPKAQFSVDVLVYVIGNNETPVYITTESNIINLTSQHTNYQYGVSLRGGDSDDYNGFEHEIIDGNDVIDLYYNNNIGTINPKSDGIARIRINHRKAAYALDIIVIVQSAIEYKYIDVDRSLVIIEEGGTANVFAEMKGGIPSDNIAVYSFEIEDDTVISVIQSQDVFSIKGIKKGRSKLSIKNEYADFDRSILVIVDGPMSMYDNEVYITTNQNVITTEVGENNILLTMTLVGGNEADRNNFTWTVDDFTVIEVESAHGTVNYRSRGITNINDKFEAQAVIKAKKVGTAIITLENPKAKNSFSVLVKVYKKGTFGVIPAVVEGLRVFRLNVDEQYAAQLQVVSGTETGIANVQWKTDDAGIMSVAGSGLSGLLTGKKNGITNVRVSGDNIKHEYQAVVIVGDGDYQTSMPFIYTRNPFISVVKGQNVFFRIAGDNMTDEDWNRVTVTNTNGTVMEVLAYRDNITITGIELGSGELIISGSGLNTVSIKVSVEEYSINPDMPFYLQSSKLIYGVAIGKVIELPIDLVGGSTAGERSILWSIANSNIANISGNGRQALVTGKSAGQTVVTVRHPKSQNELEIVVFVAEENALDSTVVVYLKEKSILMNTGETRYVSVITNANDVQKNGFEWDVYGSGVISISVSTDKVKVYLIARGQGSGTVTVRHSSMAIPAVLYVSVVDRMYDAAYMGVPSIIEMVVGDSYTVNAVTNNIGDPNYISWEITGINIASVYGNRESCLINAFASGSTVVTVRNDRIGFVKDILVYVYLDAYDMASKYLLAGEQSRYVINVGDLIEIALVFGTKGFPEHEKYNINWQINNANIISVVGNGANARVTGLYPGIGTITVGSSIANSITIEVEVREGGGKAGLYWFNIKAEDRIKGIVAGRYADIDIRVFNGNNEVYNISGVTYTVEDSNVISVVNNGTSIRVYAESNMEGQSYITVHHDLAEEARILVYTALGDVALAQAYPLLISKTSYLLQKSENITVTVSTKDNDAAKINNISYALERNNGVVTLSEKNKREVTVNAISIGSDVVLVKYNGATVQRVYVSVVENKYGSDSGYLVTENIIALVVGKEYETTVSTDVLGWVLFQDARDGVISVVSYTERTAVIKGNVIGETTLAVKAGSMERHILVAVCATGDEVKAYQAINVEQRYIRIQKNESRTINVYSYQGAVVGQTLYSDYYSYATAFGGIIEIFGAANNRLSVKGMQEGISAIRINNSAYGQSFVVYVEVHNQGNGTIGVNDNSAYITAAKTLYLIDKDDTNVMVSVAVVGTFFGGDNYWRWTGYNSSIISLEYQGSYAVINPKKEGQTTITVSNAQCGNTLTISVIVGDRFVTDGSVLPYIYVEKTVFEVSRNITQLSIPYNIVNAANINSNNVYIDVQTTMFNVLHDRQNHVVNLDIRGTGIGRFDICYGDLRRDVYIMVYDYSDYDNIYLTTGENYVIATIGELRTVQIGLVGYGELNSGKFTWSVDNSSVVQVVGNGLVGQIYGVAAGEAIITVRHPLAEPYPLRINVKVVKDGVKEGVVYLTTQRNVIETVAGNTTESIYIQKIGGNPSNNNCTWSVSDESVVSVTASGLMGQFTAKKEGVARITVRSSESLYKLEIVVVVKAALNNNIYIHSDSHLLQLKPGDIQRRIGVVLINGEPKDVNDFVWNIDNNAPFDSAIAKAGGKVISIVGSNNECFINAQHEGTAQIRVRHKKSERDLIITVYVSYFEQIGFSVRSKAIVVGDNEFVGINIPTYKYMNDKVRVWSSDTGICDVYYSNEMVLLYGRSSGNAVICAKVDGEDAEAQLLVNVTKEPDVNINKIVVSRSLYSVNLKTEPFRLDALITGAGIVDFDNDNILWEMNKTGIIDLFPSNAPVSSGKGRQVQVRPKALGTVNVLVKHGYVDEQYWKAITVIVADKNDKFSISKNDILIHNMTPQTVTANIYGGITRDYAEIKWVAEMQRKWDGTMLEVVRIMGSGREVTLYPMNDGDTTVVALYGSTIEVINVSVVSEYYFSFKTGNLYMYPGEIKDVPFDVRPVNTPITWFLNSGNNEPIIMYGEVTGSPTPENPVPVRYLHIEARHEGAQTLTGMANGKVAMLTIIVQEDYSFKMDKWFKVNNESFGIVKHSLPSPGSNGKVTIGYTVYPPNTYIKPTSIIEGLTVDVKAPDPVTGAGTIEFTGTREIAEALQFQQYKALRNNNFGVDKETLVAGNTQSVWVYYRYTKKKITPLPYFIRGDGMYSNTGNTANPYINNNGVKLGEKLSNNLYNGTSTNYEVVLGDGEVHYILFDNIYNGAKLTINGGGGNYSLPNLSKWGVEAERVRFNNNGVLQDAIRLYGGKDYIEYTRTAFNEELWLDVESKYYSDNKSSITVTEPVPYVNIHMISLSTNVRVIQGGGWSNIEQPTSSDLKVYYLVKAAYFAEAVNNGWASIAGSVAGDLWLTSYKNSYDLYFKGDESANTQFRNFINNTTKCDRVTVYKPYFIYPNSYYTQYKEMWDLLIEPGDGYAELISNNRIRSEFAHGYSTYYTDISINLPVFEYDGGVLSDRGFTTATFNHGLLENQASYKKYLGNLYNADNAYTTIALRSTYSYADPPQGDSYVSKFNVMRSTFEGPQYVHLISGNPSHTYNKGTLGTITAGKYTYEYFRYLGLQLTNAYRDGDPIQNEIPQNVPIYSTSNNMARQTTLKEKDQHFTYSTHGVNYEWWTYKIIDYFGENPLGSNILRENSWSNRYYTAANYVYNGSGWFGSGSIIPTSAESYLLYAPSSAWQRYRWVNVGTTIITPYYIFNRFPFRYISQLGEDHLKTANFINLSGKGKPMPSISNQVIKESGKIYSDSIPISFSTFDFNLGDEDSGVINLTIKYERRPCHFMYNGSQNNDSFVNYVNQSGIAEYQGEITSYLVNGKLHEHFDQKTGNGSYVVESSGGKTRLKDLINQPYSD
jgi:hypothetical protein